MTTLTKETLTLSIEETEAKLATYRGLSSIEALEMPFLLQIKSVDALQTLFSVRMPEEIVFSVMSLAEVEQTPALMRLSEYLSVSYSGESLEEMRDEIEQFCELRSKEPLTSVLKLWLQLAEYGIQQNLAFVCVPN